MKKQTIRSFAESDCSSKMINSTTKGVVSQEPLRSPGARQEAASAARGGAGNAARSRPLALAPAPPPVRQMRRSLAQLEASLAESRANEARMQRSHAALARKLHALAAALDQATHCNRALVDTLTTSPPWTTPRGPRRSPSRGRQGAPCASSAAAAGREALDALQRRLSARHRVIESLCTRFLHMKRRRDLQAAREEELAGAVRTLQALLGHATAVLRRAALELCEERLGNRTCRCCGRPEPRRAHAATQTFFGSALANGTWVRRSTISSPELALKGTARQLDSSTESLPDLILSQRNPRCPQLAKNQRTIKKQSSRKQVKTETEE